MAEGGKLRFCVFGDSHYACLKQAEVKGLVDVSGVDLEYWGHVGGRFRYLEYRDGAVHPTDDFTARRFARFNEKGRTFLPGADFDAILVMGARTHLWRQFHAVLRAMCHGPFVSAGLIRRHLADTLRLRPGYRFAAGLAQDTAARLILSPVAYPTLPVEGPQDQMTPEMIARFPEACDGFWAILTEVAAEDGIELIRQPAETVTDAMFTDPAFAVDDYLRKPDFQHRNAAYGALIFSRALDLALQTPRPLRAGAA